MTLLRYSYIAVVHPFPHPSVDACRKEELLDERYIPEGDKYGTFSMVE